MPSAAICACSACRIQCTLCCGSAAHCRDAGRAAPQHPRPAAPSPPARCNLLPQLNEDIYILHSNAVKAASTRQASHRVPCRSWQLRSAAKQQRGDCSLLPPVGRHTSGGLPPPWSPESVCPWSPQTSSSVSACGPPGPASATTSSTICARSGAELVAVQNGQIHWASGRPLASGDAFCRLLCCVQAATRMIRKMRHSTCNSWPADLLQICCTHAQGLGGHKRLVEQIVLHWKLGGQSR